MRFVRQGRRDQERTAAAVVHTAREREGRGGGRVQAQDPYRDPSRGEGQRTRPPPRRVQVSGDDLDPNTGLGLTGVPLLMGALPAVVLAIVFAACVPH
jgi:hypothetical protein